MIYTCAMYQNQVCTPCERELDNGKSRLMLESRDTGLSVRQRKKLVPKHELFCATTRASSAWLAAFCQHLEMLWITNGKGKRNRLQSFTVVMNKMDKVTEDTWRSNARKYRSVLKKLVHARGRRLKQFRILPCVLVTNPNGTMAADKVIVAVAKSLAR